MNYIYMRPKADGRQLNLPHVTKEQNSNEETKNQNQMLRRNGPVLKSVQSDSIESKMGKICESVRF